MHPRPQTAVVILSEMTGHLGFAALVILSGVARAFAFPAICAGAQTQSKGLSSESNERQHIFKG
jgi:hypothetical protein